MQLSNFIIWIFKRMIVFIVDISIVVIIDYSQKIYLIIPVQFVPPYHSTEQDILTRAYLQRPIAKAFSFHIQSTKKNEWCNAIDKCEIDLKTQKIKCNSHYAVSDSL
jgi:hypothetical protein